MSGQCAKSALFCLPKKPAAAKLLAEEFQVKQVFQPDPINTEGGFALNEPNTMRIVQQLEDQLKEKEVEISALQGELAELKQREEQYIDLNQTQIEELQELRNLAQVVRQHFNKNIAVERCIACSKCDYETLESALLNCNSFTRIRL